MDKYQTALRKQLLALGYRIIPNRGKIPAIHGWNEQDYAAQQLTSGHKGSAAERVERWERRFPDAYSTGVRLDEGLGVIDADVDDGPMIKAWWAYAMEIAPEVAEKAPMRYGGGEHKFALFVRIEGEQFVRLASRRYGKHVLEIFGGAPLKGGRCSRQFGIYGPHSEGVEYAWEAEAGRALHEVALGDLPALTRAQAAALVDVFDRLAAEAGWVATAQAEEADEGSVAYDITDAARFAVDGGLEASYADLSGLIGRRCASSFAAGDTGHNRTKCWIYWSDRHDCAAVYNHETCVAHYPADKAPIGATVFAAALQEAAALHGFVPPPPVPNWRERYRNGDPKATLHNARLAVLAVGATCHLDVFHNHMDIGVSRNDTPPGVAGPVTDASIMALRVWLSNVFGLDFTEKHVRDAVVGLAGDNQFNPVTDMLAEAEANWDGIERLDRMAVDHFGCPDTPLNRAMVRKTMVAAVARARVPGCKFDTILTLESPEGWNKSSAWAVLAGEGNFSDERIIGKDSREVVEQLAGIWIHENADLAGMYKSEVETVKAYASRVEDRARPAYGHFLIAQPRHSIEVGTTNSDEYLQSQTGNRRFWPIRMERRIDLAKLRADRLQLWGEAAAAQSAGEALTIDENLWPAAAVEQEARRVRDPWEALLADLTVVVSAGPIGGAGYPGNGVVHVEGGEQRVATAVIFRHVLRMVEGQLESRHSKRLADAMRALGWSGGVFKIDGRAVRGYRRTVVTGNNT